MMGFQICFCSFQAGAGSRTVTMCPIALQDSGKSGTLGNCSHSQPQNCGEMASRRTQPSHGR